MKIIITTILFLSLNSFAAVKITEIQNASNYNLHKLGPTIFGGISGTTHCKGNIKTINTCALNNGRAACNLNAICPSTQLALTVSAKKSGKLLLVDSDNNVIKDFGTYTGGTAVSAKIPWSDICTEVTNDATCSLETGRGHLKLGVNASGDASLEEYQIVNFKIAGIANTTVNNESLNNDTDGVDNYSLIPGNEKAILNGFSAVQDFYVYESARIVGIRGFYRESSCADPLRVTTASHSHLLNLNAEKEIITNQIPNLKNDVRYLFMFGFQDEAGNIGLFKDLAADCADDQHSVVPHKSRK